MSEVFHHLGILYGSLCGLSEISYLVDLHKDQQIIILQVHCMRRPHGIRHLLDDPISRQRIVVPDSRTNSKLNEHMGQQEGGV